MHRRSRILLVVAALLVAAAGCATDADPASWEEARAQEGFPIRDNFIRACREANTGERGFDEVDASVYCGCAFDAVEELFADDGPLASDDPAEPTPFQQFVDLEDELRSDPDDLPARVRQLYDDCAESLDE